jgi:hypothetical protein
MAKAHYRESVPGVERRGCYSVTVIVVSKLGDGHGTGCVKQPGFPAFDSEKSLCTGPAFLTKPSRCRRVNGQGQ